VRRIAKFWRRDAGAVVIDTVLWLPFVFFFMLAMADIFFLQMNLAMSTKILDENTRLFAVGRYASCADVVSGVEKRLQATMPSAKATCTNTDKILSASVTIKSTDMGIGFVTYLMKTFQVATSSVHSFEYVPGTQT
jgi:hypothetical protein